MKVAKVHVKKGDLVEVISGDDKGKRGKVLQVLPKTGKAIVDGININKKHTRPTRTNPQGGIVESPGPLSAAKLQLVCPSCDESTRVGRTRSADGKPARVCKNCGKMID